jgi:hypothetical protein
LRRFICLSISSGKDAGGGNPASGVPLTEKVLVEETDN